DDDEKGAAQAVIEGQATYEQLIATFGEKRIAALLPGGWDSMRDVIRENYSAQPVFSAAPMVIREGALFPYVNGADFVRRFKQQHPGTMPFNDLPKSTEQVMHDAAFFGPKRDDPVRVVLPAVPNTVYENTLGEFDTRLFVFEHTKDQATSLRAGNGWGGDRFVVVRTPAGNAIAWVTVWDSVLDAAEFVDAVGAGLRRRFRIAGPTVDASGARTFSGEGR